MAIVNTNTAPILKEGTNITLSQVGQTITITSSAGSSAGGSNTEVQYNSGGALEGDPSFTYNDTTNVVSLESIDFATTPAAADAERRLKWDNDEGSLVLTLKGGNLSIPLGAEVVSLVYNADATTLAKGEVVYAFGASGQRVSVKRAVNTADATSAQTFGVIAESIAAGAEGFCMVQGMVRGINTSAYTQGDPIYLSATAGQFTKTKPVAPNHLVYIGFVVKINASSGEIFVRPQNGFEMDEIHDYLEGSVQNNDVISYETSSGLYKPKSISTLLGYTPMQNPMSVLGDIIYGGASGTPTRLAGRILTSRGFLSSVGNGTNSTAPTWRRISLASDVDDTLSYTQGGTGLTTLGVSFDVLRVNSAGTALEFGSINSLISNGIELLDGYGLSWVTTLGGASNASLNFTNGSGMAFYPSSSVTPSLFLQDAVSSRVGIGTVTPSTKLDVNGDVNISTINNATTDTDKFLVSDGGIIKYRTGTEILSDIGAIGGSGTSAYIPYFTGTSTLGQSGLYWNQSSTRFGINITAVTHTLDVNGDARIRTIPYATIGTDYFIIANSAGSIQYRTANDVLNDIGAAAVADVVTLTTTQTISGQKTFSSVIQGDLGLDVLDGQGIDWRAASYGAANARISFTDTSGMALYSGGVVTPTMFLTDDGNRRVGIGTTTPGYKLDVNGTLGVTGAATFSGAVGIVGAAGTNGTKLFVQGSVSSIFDAAGTRGISFYPSQTSIHFITSDYIGTSYYPLAFSARGVNSDLYLSTGGNVGIGIASPSYKLDVNGTLGVTGAATFSSSTMNIGTSTSRGNVTIEQTTGNSGLVVNSAIAEAPTLYLRDGGGSGYSMIQANNNLYINASKVGIGTTSPSYKLDVNGTGGFTNGINVNSTGGEMVNINVIDNSARQGIRLNNGINASGGIVLFNSSSSTGTETGGLLRVHQQSTSLSQPSAVFRQDGNADILQLQGSSGSVKMLITSSGNVGINTTSPSQRLHVASTGVSRILIENIDNSGTGAGLQMLVTSGGSVVGNGTIRTDNTDQMQFFNSGGERMRITSGGNVGINDTNPSYRLSVTGDQKITSGSLGINVNPNATDGRIDASNDIVAYSSDKRLKRNIKEIEDALYKIQKLQGFTYNWNDLAKEKAGFDTDINMVGLFAQDVQEVLPEAVKLAPFDNNGNDESISGENYLTVQYDKLVPLLIEAIKDLNNKYNQLKNGI